MGSQRMLYHILQWRSSVASARLHSVRLGDRCYMSGCDRYILRSAFLIEALHMIGCRSFSWRPSSEDTSTIDDIRMELVDGSAGIQRCSPVSSVICLLDDYHDFTGFPWWITIASSTLGLRLALLPILVLQIKKLTRIFQLLPHLPPPLPPPLSGIGFVEQFLLFRKARQASGCPSLLWKFASFIVQVPCFIIWVTSIRRMSLNNHAGFDSGGALWFQDLSEFPHGTSAPIFPVLIAAMHFINVQISFGTSSVRSFPGIIGSLARYYKLYLDILTIPIFLTVFCLPQGSLVYWFTNSLLSAIQQLSLKHPYIQERLGLPAVHRPLENRRVDMPPRQPRKLLSLENPYIFQKLGLQPKSVQSKSGRAIEDLSTEELLERGLQHLVKGNRDEAFPILRLASDMDTRMEKKAALAMGLSLLSSSFPREAAEYFQCAISQIEDDEIAHMIIALYGAGISLMSQGKNAEGIEYLKRIGELKEPEMDVDKFCYYQAITILGCVLLNEGVEAEGLKYLHVATKYDPGVHRFIEEWKCGKN